MSGAATLGLRVIHIILKHATTRKKASVYFEREYCCEYNNQNQIK